MQAVLQEAVDAAPPVAAPYETLGRFLLEQKKFDEAAAMCKKMKGTFGGQMDKYYKMWIERCDFMKQQDLGPDWNGEFIAHEK